MSTVGNGGYYSLSCRITRPIEGCEIVAHPYMVIKGGAMDNSTRMKLLDSKPYTFVYNWYRRYVSEELCELLF